MYLFTCPILLFRALSLIVALNIYLLRLGVAYCCGGKLRQRGHRPNFVISVGGALP